jgi:hypothetical protein
MKTIASFALLILAAFVGWLFYNSISSMELKNRDLTIKENQLKLDRIKEDRFTGEDADGDYTIISVPDGMTYLLDRETGIAWRWFRNRKDGEIEDEGWTPVIFKISDYQYADPHGANSANKYFQDFLRKRGANKQQGDSEKNKVPSGQ